MPDACWCPTRIEHRYDNQFEVSLLHSSVVQSRQCFGSPELSIKYSYANAFSNHCFMFLQARIDSQNKILYARHADQRNATFQRVLQTGNEFDRDVKAMLLRANLIKHDYNLKTSRKS